MRTFILVVFSVFISSNAVSKGTMVNLDVVAGSIRDIAPNLNYIEWRFNWASHVRGVRDDLQNATLSSVRELIENDTKELCSKYTEEYPKVFYGVDNITISKRHMEEENRFEHLVGHEVTATFNEYCAY